MKDRFDSHVKFYRRRERGKCELRSFYDEAWQFYSEQLRRYRAARPDWRTIPAAEHDFWEKFPNW